MARYSGMGWHNQSIRHSNARKYGRAGGKYSDDNLRLAFHTQQPMFSTKVAQLLNQGFSEKQAVKKVEDELLVGYKKWQTQGNKHFGYAQTGFKTFQLKDGYEIIAHWEKTRNGFRHIAILMKDGSEVDRAKATYTNRTWESYEYQTVIRDLLDKTKILSEPEQKAFLEKGELQARKEADEMFGNIGAIAGLGEIMTSNKKESNDWKARMIKAGLGSNIDIPEDWNTLSEDEKEKRLNKVIEFMRKK